MMGDRQWSELPLMERIVLRGGPLNGERRRVERAANRAWFKPPLSDQKYLYRRDITDPGVWVFADGVRP